MKYRVLVRKSPLGYTAVCPGLPDTESCGATEDEALANLRDAIDESLSEREGLFWQDAKEGESLREVEVSSGNWLDIGRGGTAARYKIEVIKHSEGYAVSCPMLPGCLSQGDTMEEALSNIQMAIKEWLISVQETILFGQPDVEVIEVADDESGYRSLRGNAMKYRVLLHKSEDGYSVVCPGLPGCHAQGDSEDEALGNIREVIQDFLARREEMFWQDVRDGEEMREVEVVV